jgi:NAD(P)H-flavin reductase
MNGQAATDDLVSTCVLAAGENTTYLKDFRVQLPKAASNDATPVYKANMYLMKNMKYRFSVCDAPASKGELVVTIYDQGKELISSFNKSTGKQYNSVDFICNKTGLYTLWYGFKNGEQGSGVGVVSMIK